MNFLGISDPELWPLSHQLLTIHCTFIAIQHLKLSARCEGQKGGLTVNVKTSELLQIDEK